MDSLFDNYGFISSGVLNLSPVEAFELCTKGAVIVDVREDYLNNFKNFDVNEIIILPKSKLEQECKKLPEDKYLIFADTVGLRSKEAVIFLRDKGFEKIANMAGGIVDWERDGLPLKTNIEEKLSGSCVCQLKPRFNKLLLPKLIHMKTKSLGFIGGGRVTRILLQAFANKNVQFADIVVADPNKETADKLKKTFPVIKISDALTAACQDIVFISLHPPVILDTIESLKEQFKPGSAVISLAPKITIGKISSKLGQIENIARLIPNATSFINEGYNPVSFSPGFATNEKLQILELLGVLGNTFEVPEVKLENYAIMSAMLPTYFWFQWKELTDIGIKTGLTEEETKDSIYNTLISALNLMFKSGIPPAEVIDLIPVKPIGENETQITEIYRSKLPALFEKIKP